MLCGCVAEWVLERSKPYTLNSRDLKPHNPNPNSLLCGCVAEWVHLPPNHLNHYPRNPNPINPQPPKGTAGALLCGCVMEWVNFQPQTPNSIPQERRGPCCTGAWRSGCTTPFTHARCKPKTQHSNTQTPNIETTIPKPETHDRKRDCRSSVVRVRRGVGAPSPK